MTFTPTAKGTRHEERIVLNLSHNNDIVIDRAIVRFGKGKSLPKFQMNPSHTKIYIPQDGKDYAIAVIARRNDEAIQPTEQPINFKTQENGTYTLTFSTENVDLDYLHLIDNLTGADIDLLSSRDCGSSPAMTVPCVNPTNPNPETVIAGNDPQSPTPSYTFTAKTTDYASRFRLVFVCGDANDDNETFAFINNGNIIVNGDDIKTQKIVNR